MIILIPSYQPNQRLLEVIRQIQNSTDFSIVVVDDGSGVEYESYFQQAKELGCTVLQHARNMGKGAALKTGFAHIRQTQEDACVVCADSDGQHRIEDIIRVAEAIDPASREMVLGVRQFQGKVPWKSRLGNTLTSFLFGMVAKSTISDTQTGLRGYPPALFDWLLSVEGDRFEYEFHLLLGAGAAGVTTRQIPIQTIYEQNNAGTHFDPIRDSFRIYLPLLKFGMSSFASFLLDFGLLFLFQAITGSLFLGVLFARIISSIFNYSVNKIMVFKARGVSHLQSAPRYFSLVAALMLVNYAFLWVMTTLLHIPGFWAKLLTEMLLFLFSYFVQKKFIFVFRKRRQQQLGVQDKFLDLLAFLRR